MDIINTMVLSIDVKSIEWIGIDENKAIKMRIRNSEFLRILMPFEMNWKKEQTNEEGVHRTRQYHTWKRTEKTMKLFDEK